MAIWRWMVEEWRRFRRPVLLGPTDQMSRVWMQDHLYRSGVEWDGGSGDRS